MQKYIVWPTPKPKSDFHKALETAFPVYDALFQKSKPKESQAQAESEERKSSENDDENVVDNWEQAVGEDLKTELSKSDELEGGDTSETGTSEEGRDGAALLKNSNMKAQEMETYTADANGNDHSGIVLGPGGQWGQVFERNPLMCKVNGAAASSSVPAWSLPTAGQQQCAFS